MRAVCCVATLLVATIVLAATPAVHAVTTVWRMTTPAGSASLPGHGDGTGSTARFFRPEGIALSASGGFAIIADTQNNTIRRIDLAGGAVTTVAGMAGMPGSTDGISSTARFLKPTAVTLASDCPFGLVADTDNHTIRQFDLASGAVTTIAGKAGQPGDADGTDTARFDSPSGVALDANCGFALVADTGNHIIRRVDLANSSVITLAGTAGSRGGTDGNGATARFNTPVGLALSTAGFALVGDTGNHIIRRVDLASGAVTTVAGLAGAPGSVDGPGSAARFTFPRGVTLSDAGGFALVADFSNSTLRRLDLANGAVTTIAGEPGNPGAVDGLGGGARLTNPAGIAVSSTGGIVLVADTGNHTVRRLDPLALPQDTWLPLAKR
jgi:sugar lactone lactonase YvrE